MECNSVIETTYGKLSQKGFKCKSCNPNMYDEEIAVMLKANLKPLEPYPGNSAKIWKCQCMLCGSECFPRYYDVSKKNKGGCKPCSLIPSPETITKAIEIVADRKKLSYIIDESATLYSKGGIDCTAEVMIELLRLDAEAIKNK